MNICWDETKRRTNLVKHRMDFRDAEAALSGPTVTVEDVGPYDEQRFLTLGLLRSQVVVVAHAERGDQTRIISMRKALKYERETYFSYFRN
ncbi:MAG: BrnT family toxin [Magnetococcales bacterium]|nr:BrnT family toxin [Magnetococcales bacterium]